MCNVHRYLRYADAGDQFVGRTIALVGFLNSWMFAVLPPHFISDVHATVLELFPICVIMPSMIPICRLVLASVVYHATKNEKGFDFAPDHELYKSALFCDRSKLEELSEKLNADSYKSEQMTATGIPPYVCLFMAIAGIPEQVKGVFTEVLRGFNLVPRIDESAIIQQFLQKLTSIEARLTAVTTTVPALRLPLLHDGVPGVLIPAIYNEKLKRWSCVPEGYKLPKKLIDIFSHWSCMSTWNNKPVPALSSACLSMQDFDKSEHRAWSQVKGVMHMMHSKMPAPMVQALQSPVLTVPMCHSMYQTGMTAKIWGVLSTGDHARMKVSYACALLQRGGGFKKRKRGSEPK
jgi:hypothetical protein